MKSFCISALRTSAERKLELELFEEEQKEEFAIELKKEDDTDISHQIRTLKEKLVCTEISLDPCLIRNATSVVVRPCKLNIFSKNFANISFFFQLFSKIASLSV